MSEPFLIAHVVRGKPAFDIAEQVVCPICRGDYDIDRDEESMCVDCDDTGHWWIIPTSGHRAYPYWNIALESIDDRHCLELDGSGNGPYTSGPPLPPSSWPDHYAINNRALRSEPSSSLAERLGLNVRQPSAPVRRRV